MLNIKELMEEKYKDKIVNRVNAHGIKKLGFKDGVEFVSRDKTRKYVVMPNGEWRRRDDRPA